MTRTTQDIRVKVCLNKTKIARKVFRDLGGGRLRPQLRAIWARLAHGKCAQKCAMLRLRAGYNLLRQRKGTKVATVRILYTVSMDIYRIITV